MGERGLNRIVNLLSLIVLGFANGADYAGAKVAMISFTEVWVVDRAQFVPMCPALIAYPLTSRNPDCHDAQARTTKHDQPPDLLRY